MIIAEATKKKLQETGLWNKTNFSEEQQALKENFKKALRYIKKMPENKPWYLTIGPIHSGKTSLLIHSHLNFNYTEQLVQFTPTEYENLGHSNWWLTENGIFIDVPGRYLDLEEGKAPKLWLNLLKLLSKYQAPLKGIILTLSVAELVTFSKAEQAAYYCQLRHRLGELAKIIHIPYLPIDVFLCKSDLLAGFVQFFDDLGHEECAQPVGLSFAQAPTLNQFNQEFDQLIKRLNTRLIWRIHQERNIKKRILIKDYPLQFSSLKNALGRVIYYLDATANYNNKLCIRNIYFTSSLQQGTPIDCLLRTLSSSFELTPTWLDHLHKSKPYFIKQCFTQYIMTTSHKKFTTSLKLNIPIFNYFLVGLLLLFCILIYQYSKDENHKYRTAMNLLTYAQQLIKKEQYSNLLQTVKAESALQNATQLLSKIHRPGLAIQNRLQAIAQLEIPLQKKFLSALIAELEKRLMIEQDPYILYNDLKAYTGLSDPKQANLNTIQAWLNHFSEIHLSPIWLNSVLSFNPIRLNQSIIAQARTVLGAIPYEKLAYSVLQNHYKTELNLTEINQMKTKQARIIFSSAIPHINELYTAKNFNQIYYKDIPEICQELIKNSELLAKPIPKNTSLDSLQDTVRKLYLADYLGEWLNLFKHIEFNIPDNLNDLQELIHNFATPSSPLWRLLHTIDANIKYPSTMHLTFASTLPTFLPKNSLPELIQNFNKLQIMLDTISDNQAAFNLVAARMGNVIQGDPLTQLRINAQKLPLSMQTWLVTITQTTWSLLFNAAQKHIEETWQNTILPFYKERIADRYPLKKSAVRDIASNDFIQFFGPNGLLDSFFKQKLKPFIDMQQAQWYCRHYAGKALSFSDKTLLEFERAAIIRSMFFPEKQLNLDINFTLIPLTLASYISQATLFIQDQRIAYNRTDSVLHHLIWSSNTDNPTTKLIWRDKHGQTYTLSEKGPWAFFRLLDKAQIKTMLDTQHLQIDFDFNGFSASYALVAKYPINPFIPDVIDKFYCPDQLTIGK